MDSLKRSRQSNNDEMKDIFKRNRNEIDLGDKKDHVLNIIQREFQNEINKRQEEAHLIQKRLLKAQKSLHLLKYVVIKSFYDRKDLKITNNDELNVFASSSLENKNISICVQDRIHPAVKKILGKRPIDFESYSSRTRIKARNSTEIRGQSIEAEKSSDNNTNVLPNPNICQIIGEESLENIPRGNQKKVKHEIVIGNISKYSPSSNPQDNSSHKWMMYVRGPRNNPDISHFVKKVRFFLHPSYQPNDIIEIEDAPFHLSRRGWGEFPLRVQIHFQCSFNKPVDIIHNLKLDQTKSGRQILGKETNLNVWLYNTLREEKQINQIAKCLKQEINENELKHRIENTQLLSNIDEDVYAQPSCSNSNTPNNFNNLLQENELKIIHANLGFRVIKTEPVDEANISYKNHSESINTQSQQYKTELYSDEESNMNSARDADEVYDEDNIYLMDHCYTEEIILDNFLRNTRKHAIHIPLDKFNSTYHIVYFLFKSLPLITNLVRNPTYKCCYPYAAENFEEFASWNIGKQRCSEWYRAKEIKELLILNDVTDQRSWSIKFILMFGRAHAFTPFANYEIFQIKNETGNISKQQTESENVSTFTEYMPISKIMMELSLREGEAKDDCILDVENANLVQIKQEFNYVSDRTISSEYDKSLRPLCTYVRQCTEEINITLEDEEIDAGVLHNSSERVLLQAVMCLAEELIRKAWASKVTENKGRDLDKNVDRNNIYKVLLEREEFDIFTNDGLGKKVDI